MEVPRTRIALGMLLGTLLVLLACAPATQPAAAPAAPAAPAPAKAPQQPAAPAPAAPAAAPAAPVAAPAPAAPARPTGLPQYGGTLVFVQQQGRLPHLDPILSTANTTHPQVHLVYNKLVMADWVESPLKPTISPDLAERWEVSKDGLTMTFHLAKGVKVQDNTVPPIPGLNGREFTSADVKYSLERVAYDPASLFQATYRFVDKFETPDKYTFVIKMKEFDVDLLTALSAHHGWMVTKELVEKYGNLKTAIIGTGPFIFEKWVKDVAVSFKRNPNYFKKGLPYVDRVETIFIQDKKTQETAFRTGKISSYEFRKFEFEDMIKSRPDLQWMKHLQDGTTILAMHYNNPIFKDVRLRKAMFLALDHDKLVKIFTDGDGGWRGPVSSMHEGWALSQEELRKLMAYDPAQARKLMEELGYSKGIELEMLHESTGGVEYIGAGDLVVESMRAIGINIKLDTVPNAIHRRRRDAQDYKHLYWGPDGQNTPLAWLVGNYRTGGFKNVMALSDPKLDAWIDKTATTVDEEERKKGVLEIQRWLLSNYYYKVPMFDIYTYPMWQPNIRNLKIQLPHFSGTPWITADNIWIEK